MTKQRRQEESIQRGVFRHDVVAVREGLFALELKVEGGRLSQAQRATQEALRAAGAAVATSTGLDEALAQLERWGFLRGACQ